MRARGLLFSAAVAAVIGLTAAQAAPRQGAHPLPLRTALAGEGNLQADAAQVRQTGITMVRLTISWSAIAPGGSAKPAFNAADPADPAYDWTSADAAVSGALADGLQPIIDIIDAPSWAEENVPRPYYGSIKPSPLELGLFAQAIATRYSGTFENQPRVRLWQLWNEPNLIYYLQPQYDHGRLFSPGWYRSMVNEFADAVHSVRPDNVVIAGGTAPFTSFNGAARGAGVSPLVFMRTFFCLNAQLRPSCSKTVAIDAWAHHPYTSGGPTHHAQLPGDVSLGDLPEMKTVLDAAWKYHRIRAAKAPQFWVTEFSWDTSPPDPQAVPLVLQARWVSEALHVMWQNGISVVTWFTLFDQPMSQSPYQSGLFFAPDASGVAKPKPALTAFRFPFVAYRHGGSLDLWGRTPDSHGGMVTVEQARGGSWIRLGAIRAASNGIFDGTLAPRGQGKVRARLGSQASLPFSLVVPPDHFYNPFGTP
jgi:hypothetical protein